MQKDNLSQVPLLTILIGDCCLLYTWSGRSSGKEVSQDENLYLID